LLFSALKLIGAVYLVYLGIGLLRMREHDFAVTSSALRSPARLFSMAPFPTPRIRRSRFSISRFCPSSCRQMRPTRRFPSSCSGWCPAALTFVMKAPIGLFAGVLSGWLRARPAVLKWLFHAGSSATRFPTWTSDLRFCRGMGAKGCTYESAAAVMMVRTGVAG
jgi:hypothetical protein